MNSATAAVATAAVSASQPHNASYVTVDHKRLRERATYDPQAARGDEKRFRMDLGPGSFRSKSRQLVDQNPRSRENVMRTALEELLGYPFVKTRPAFLLNPATKRRLELDAYCEPLCLAAEFHGQQHYVFPNSCHSTRAAFELQKQRDQLKVQLCRQHGTKLLVVPDTVSRCEVREYVSQELRRLGFEIKQTRDTELAAATQPTESDLQVSDESPNNQTN